MLACVIFAAAIAILKLAPDTAVGRALHRLMVEAPVNWLGRFSPRTLLLAALLIAGGVALIVHGGPGGRAVAAQGLPEGLAWIAAFDVGTWIDLVVAGWLVAAAVRLKSLREGGRWLRLRLTGRRPRISPRARARRIARRRPAPPPGNEDEPPAPVFVRAA